MHGHSNLPPFDIIEKISFSKTRRGGCLQSPPWVMVKDQPVIHSSIGAVMRLAIQNHAQITKPRSNRWKAK